MNPDFLSQRLGAFRLFCVLMISTGLMVGALPGCGGGGSDGLLAGGGVGGTGVSMGAVSGHGSVIVNGIRWDTASADIYFENVPLGAGDQTAREWLPIGQEVVVQGNFKGAEDGTATRVDAFVRVRGPLEAIEPLDAFHSRLVVMGQTVYVGPQTRWDGVGPPGTLEEPVLGMVLDVSGPVDAEGAVRAGRIARHADYLLPNTVLMVKGAVEALDVQGRTFNINGLLIDYNQARVDPAWLNFRTVSVAGRLSGGVLLADEVKPFAPLPLGSVPFFFLEGFVIPTGGPDPWAIEEVILHFDDQTDFDGIASSDIQAGIQLQVRGTLHDHVLQVTSVQPVERIRLESNVAFVDPEGGFLELEGMPSLAIKANALTRIIAGGPARDLADIGIGDHLRIFGQALDGQSVAARMMLVVPGQGLRSRFLLEGPVTAVGYYDFEILGVPVDTEANSGIRFEDAVERPLSRHDFMAALMEDTVVRVTGSWADGGLDYEYMGIKGQATPSIE